MQIPSCVFASGWRGIELMQEKVGKEREEDKDEEWLWLVRRAFADRIGRGRKHEDMQGGFYSEPEERAATIYMSV